MHRRITSLGSLAAIAVLAIAAIATAAVTFDPETGEGFVGKGDVQTAFGWNNKQLQDNAKDVTFSYNTSEEYDVVCYWETGPEKNITEHRVTTSESTAVESGLEFNARKNSNGKDGDITGFFLNGLGSISVGGDSVPQVGDPCPGNPGNGKAVESVTPVGEGAVGGLYATFDGDSVLLNPSI